MWLTNLIEFSAVDLWAIELPQTLPVSGCLVRGVIEGEIRDARELVPPCFLSCRAGGYSING